MSHYRTQEQWLELITQCRQSGMTDMDWCRANGISRSTFYKALSRLREAACKVPQSEKVLSNEIDLTSAGKPDIVPVRIIPDEITSDAGYVDPGSSPYVMEITSGDITIRVSNDINSSILSHALRILGGMS